MALATNITLAKLELLSIQQAQFTKECGTSLDLTILHRLQLAHPVLESYLQLMPDAVAVQNMMLILVVGGESA
jgi:hypothetical protein